MVCSKWQANTSRRCINVLDVFMFFQPVKKFKNKNMQIYDLRRPERSELVDTTTV